MELEQLVSFVRYQRGQKTGWDALDEVLTIVLEAKERVAASEKQLQALEVKQKNLNLILEDLEETRVHKLAETELELRAKREDFETPLKTAKDALGREIKELDELRLGALAEAEVAKEKADQEKLNLSSLLDQVAGAKRELEAVNKAKADLKASL